MAAHPFGDNANHTVFVPAGFVFPDGSKAAGTAQPDGAAAGIPENDTVMGRIVTMDHTEAAEAVEPLNENPPDADDPARKGGY